MMTKEEIRRVAEMTNMTLEDARKYRSSERKALRKAIDGMVKTKVNSEAKMFAQEAHTKAEHIAICNEVIKMKETERKEMKKQIKEDTKILKKIEKNRAKVEKRNNKIVELTKKMKVKAATC